MDATPAPVGPSRAAGAALHRSRWTSPRALIAHAALLVWVPGCAVAAWWQVGIALGGDSLGWIYSVMWPVFAVFGTVFWWYLVHDDPETLGRRGLRRLHGDRAALELAERTLRDATLAEAEAEDPELAAYNAYLASLSREGRPGTWRNP